MLQRETHRHTHTQTKRAWMLEKVIRGGNMGQGRLSRDCTLRANDRILRLDTKMSGSYGRNFEKSYCGQLQL